MPPLNEIKETDNVIPIPVVDGGQIASLTEEEFDLKDPKIIKIAKEFAKALHEHGFVYLSNHGIPEDIVENAFEVSRTFFSLPKEIKEKSAKVGGDVSVNFHGYASPGAEMLYFGDSNVKEWKEMFDIFFQGERPFPTEDMPSFEPTMKLMSDRCRNLDTKLVRLLAVALELDDTNYFLDRMQNLTHPDDYTAGTLHRAILYPLIPENLKNTGTWIGCNEHADWGVVTLLFQDTVGGLEVKTAQGDWVRATPIPNTIVCNTGGLLAHWTSGYFPATFHRVHVRPVRENDAESEKMAPRQSVVFFSHPDDEVLVEPLESPVLTKDPALKPIYAGEYFKHRSKLAYGQDD